MRSMLMESLAGEDVRAMYGIHIKWFADEILSAGFQRPQLVTRLRGDHQHRKIAVPFRRKVNNRAAAALRMDHQISQASV